MHLGKQLENCQCQLVAARASFVRKRSQLAKCRAKRVEQDGASLRERHATETRMEQFASPIVVGKVCIRHSKRALLDHVTIQIC